MYFPVNAKTPCKLTPFHPRRHDMSNLIARLGTKNMTQTLRAADAVWAEAMVCRIGWFLAVSDEIDGGAGAGVSEAEVEK